MALFLHDAFSARIGGVESLLRAVDPRTVNPEELRRCAGALDTVAPDYVHLATAVAYSAFAELLRICALLVEWRAAVLEAGAEADRFLRGAKERRKLWLTEFTDKAPAAILIERSRGIEGLIDVGDVANVLATIAETSLPVGVIKAEHGDRFSGIVITPGDPSEETGEPVPQLAVAFLKFALNGSPAAETHFLTPGQIQDLEIEVRVSRWPEGADALEIRPLSIDPPGTYEFPVFHLSKPQGEAPYTLKERGRAILKVGQGLYARPFEFRYSAHFTPNAVEQPVAVVGQRTLRIESIDLKHDSLTGYPGLDSKILKLREDIRSQPLVLQEDLGNALKILIPLTNFAGRCVQDNLIREKWTEARFQAEIRGELRRSASVGVELEEHPHAAGGETDLSFRGLRIELKVGSNKRLELADCRRFLGQTVSYAVASGKRIGILCVLDCSPKKIAPFPVEDGVGIFVEGKDGAAVCVITVLFQANLARPSDLSR